MDIDTMLKIWDRVQPGDMPMIVGQPGVWTVISKRLEPDSDNPTRCIVKITRSWRNSQGCIETQTVDADVSSIEGYT